MKIDPQIQLKLKESRYEFGYFGFDFLPTLEPKE